MKRLLNVAARLGVATALLAFCSVMFCPSQALAQGVTTGAMAGIVTNTQMQPVQGASVIAIHEPSGTTYEAVTRADGRFAILGMRVGGPYSVAINYVGTGAAFEPRTVTDLTVTLGVGTDVNVEVRAIAVQETVTVMATAPDAVFSSSRTGAATSVSREQIALIPTLNGRISDMTRLTPQAGGSGFAGQDNRMNNITVDGSSFNSSFGLGGQPGDRTGVAPISLEAIEQIQVNVAPFDVRQGSFIGAGVNTVTRSGTNRLSGSFYHRFRDQDWVGTEARGQVVNPGRSRSATPAAGRQGRSSATSGSRSATTRTRSTRGPLTTFRANPAAKPVAGQITRVLASDLTALSDYLRIEFNYETGPFEAYPDETPAKRFLLRSDYNINNSNKVSFRYNYLDSFSDVGLSGSDVGAARPRANSTAAS